MQGNHKATFAQAKKNAKWKLPVVAKVHHESFAQHLQQQAYAQSAPHQQQQQPPVHKMVNYVQLQSIDQVHCAAPDPNAFHVQQQSLYQTAVVPVKYFVPTELPLVAKVHHESFAQHLQQQPYAQSAPHQQQQQHNYSEGSSSKNIDLFWLVAKI